MIINQVCYRTLGLEKPWSLKSYLSIGGYKTFIKIIKEKTPPKKIIDILKDSSLRGRGGAGFPTGLKWSFIQGNNKQQRYVICNSDESEPGTFKDRDILLYNPHQLFEGMMIACYVMSASVGYNFLRGEFWEPFQRCESALEELRECGMLGRNILNSGVDIEIFNHYSAGAYICGEETALMNSLEGKRGLPRFKPPFPANSGLYGCPTNINNAETYASVPVILEKGSDWFLQMGKKNNGGTKIFSVSGHVNKPGNYEVPLGTPFSELLNLAGGMKDQVGIKAVIPGGSSMPVLPAEIIMKTNMDYDSIREAGSMLGSGAVIVMNEKTCMVRVLARVSKFYMHESCGQCTPCREGTGWMYRIVQKIENGNGSLKDLESLGRIAKNIEGRTICAFGEAASWPVSGFLKYFYEEFEHHVKYKSCLESTL